MVAARHLFHFGYYPVVVYPKRSKNSVLFDGLIKQLKTLNIPIVNTIQEAKDSLIQANMPFDSVGATGGTESRTKMEFDCIIDAIFGFSFKGQVRDPFGDILHDMKQSGVRILSVDIPSGWDVEQGDGVNSELHPYGLISLTAPKKCVKNFNGRHWLGGRFIPPFIVEKYGLVLPQYEGVSQVVELTEPSPSNAAYEENDEYSIVWITAPPQEAKQLASSIVGNKLAACVNIMPSVTSVYVWQGETMDEEESLLMVKTRSKLLSKLTDFVQLKHSYVVPETIAVNMVGGNAKYLEWLKENTRDDDVKKKK